MLLREPGGTFNICTRPTFSPLDLLHFLNFSLKSCMRLSWECSVQNVSSFASPAVGFTATRTTTRCKYVDRASERAELEAAALPGTTGKFFGQRPTQASRASISIEHCLKFIAQPWETIRDPKFALPSACSMSHQKIFNHGYRNVRNSRTPPWSSPRGFTRLRVSLHTSSIVSL